jgi:cation transport protein ChaC
MWIFGYGSLMFDGWESERRCVERTWAELAGYRRVFNKRSDGRFPLIAEAWPFASLFESLGA